MNESYDWIDLSSAYYWVRETFLLSIYDPEGASKNAVLSGEVPTRGKARFSSAYQRIEDKITDDTELSVTTNTVRIPAPTWKPGELLKQEKRFEAVQVNRLRFEEWIISNAVDSAPATKAPTEKLDTNEEQEIVNYLEPLVRADPDRGPETPWDLCRHKFLHLPPLGSKPWRRIWQKARKQASAGKARTGPKPRK
jgi:hypothetical protein